MLLTILPHKKRSIYCLHVRFIIIFTSAVIVQFETGNITAHESEGIIQVSLIKYEQSIDNMKLDISTRQYVPYTAGQNATNMFLSFTIILHN